MKLKKNFVVLAALAGFVLSFSLVSCGGKAALVGEWVHENGEAPRGFPDELGLFKDNTGYVYGKDVPCTWWIPEKGHLQMEVHWSNGKSTEVILYKVSGATLILNDGYSSEKYKKAK